jgi:peptide/nickel transport system substrate-binding protein
MKSGEADIAMNVSFDALGELDGVEGVASAALDSYNFIHLNLNYWAPGGEVLADKRVRQAIRYAIDYEALIDATLAGNGRTQATAIPNGYPGTEDLPLPEHDPEKAKALLAEAGLADGFTIEAMYFQANIYGVDFDTMWQRIQQDLKAVGIDVQLKPVDGPQWVDAMSTTGIPFTTTFFAPDFIDASEYIQYFGPVTGSSRGFGVPVPGATYEPNAEADALLQQGLAQADAERAATWAKVGAIMVDEAEVLPIVNPKTLFVFRTDIPVTVLSPCCILDLSRLGTN